MSKMPLAIDLFAGLGGWTDGLLEAGYYVVGFDIERHVYGERRYPAQLVLQDVLTLHGSQFRDAALIVASPPCQAYSYMAMPWSRAKAKAAAIRADKTGTELERLNRLFNAYFRIQREACEAAGRHIPMVVENVRGAIPWVGRSRWNFGSFHLWGDVPALMPPARAIKVNGFRFDGSGRSLKTASVEETGVKNGGDWFGSGKDCSLQRRYSGSSGLKRPGIKLSEVGFNVSAAQEYGAMVDGADYERSADDKRQHIGIKRKFASAMIAKIPLPLSRHIAQVYLP